MALVAILANGVGAIDVFIFTAFLLPRPSISAHAANALAVRSAIGLAVYLPLTFWLGSMIGARRFAPLRRWLAEGRPAGEIERRLALRLPLELSLVSMLFWAIAALLFSLLAVPVSGAVALRLAVTAMLGGLSTSALAYLLAERISRPVTAMALAAGPPARPVGPGVTARVTMAWLVASGVPVAGVAAIAILQLAGVGSDTAAAARSMLFLALAAGGVGLFAIILATRSVAEPVANMRAALAQLEAGNFEARVAIGDGSEIGLLGAGFNHMAAGLGERERMRDLFGRHVGKEVARAALEGGVAMGGEEREIAALFVDLVGSTQLASERAPAAVVGLLNSFFGIVVEVAEAHGGFVNKFEGDAALCVFGAPVRSEDPAGEALASARTLRERLGRELPELEVGIGVSAGAAVAGNVGAEERFEYTVIGDPVNEAARLCELAKQHPGRLLASEAALGMAAGPEGRRWRLGEAVTLRGRSSPTRLASVEPGALTAEPEGSPRGS